MGDFNARIGLLPDFIDNDSSNHIPVPPGYSVDTHLNRCNMDKFVNTYGRKLIHLCKTSNIRIMNGRLPGDICGKFS